MKKFLFLLCIIILPAQAFEDCVIITDGKLSDISIEKNDIVDVYPLFTIMNEKNTLFVHPLKTGMTRLCVLKNGKDKVMFNIEVTEDKTNISDAKGFEIYAIDQSPESEVYNFELDLPPEVKQ